MTTVNSTTPNTQTYEKNTDVTLRSETKTEVQTDKSISLSTNDRLQTYTVKTGDNLWNISKDKLGTPQKWPNIFEINKDQIKDPNLIYPGQVFKLPLAEEKQDVEPTPQEKPVTEEPKIISKVPSIEPNISVEPEKPIEDNKSVDNKPVNVTPEPQKPAVISPTPETKPAIVVSKNHISVKSAAGISGAIGAAFTAGTLIGMTAALGKPTVNLGGYATAQIVAKNLGKVGFSLGNAAQVSKLVKSVGGPKVAGAIVVVGVGLTVAGLVAGGTQLYNKVSNNN